MVLPCENDHPHFDIDRRSKPVSLGIKIIHQSLQFTQKGGHQPSTALTTDSPQGTHPRERSLLPPSK
ncbi:MULTISPECIES: hypothetical protein [Planktothricoides]|uniref:Uncharacterized protein n=2 Tax=Planktothricoides raciborskii TaxID=132608 RepID=A0AAU8J9S5_9CYAN|nr:MULTISPECIES: hypothetical protein [Planktothricoides]KOR37072.1 hypothetical protein AM228_08690 [Planktothricoides sp. SR001]MBD2544679.1 hypothetical protein [Planktothricoides raciborskii FACHB-1370]MBD2580763.1 hypothetical protein [Planktothricoides raciborskii FACHB-1261]